MVTPSASVLWERTVDEVLFEKELGNSTSMGLSLRAQKKAGLILIGFMWTIY